MPPTDKVPELSVIVPAYREGGQIGVSIRALTAHLDELGLDYEVVLVCDGSPDGTFAEALDLDSGRVQVCGYAENMGKGYALCYGFQRTRGGLVCFIDADMDLDPRGIGRFIELMTRERADAVIGSKRHPESVVEYPAFRRVQSWVYQVLVRVLFNLNLTDTQTGLKLFRREVLATVLPKVRVRRFAFDLEVLLLAHHFGYTRLREAPVDLHYQFTTTTGIRAVVNVLADTLKIAWRFRVLRTYDTSTEVPLSPVVELRPERSGSETVEGGG